MLRDCPVALSRRYDVALLDLDGVVYVGPQPVPDAPAALSAARSAGMHLAFVTNNAARTPEQVAAHLQSFGVGVDPTEVVTSAQAAARLLAEALPDGAKVFVIGGEGLFVALTQLGLEPVQSIDEEPVAVVSGYHPDLRWKTVIDGAILVRKGLPWVASNTDGSVPTAHGPGPGNGVLVKAVADFADRQPQVAGKPERALLDETLLRVKGKRPLVVGDRLDTDIEGANRAELDSLLVMTGVTGLTELCAASPELRPTYVGAGLGALGTPQPRVAVQGLVATVGGWTADSEGGELTVKGEGELDDWWRAVASSAWAHLDETGRPVAGDKVDGPGSVTRVEQTAVGD